MSREVRRVPAGWRHPTEPNPYWEIQRSTPYGRSKPPSRLLAPREQFVPLSDDYPGALAAWEREGRALAAREGFDWTFSLRWHLTGTDDCSCHRGQSGVVHPLHVEEDGVKVEVAARDEDHLHAVLTAQHEDEKPDPDHHMPVFDVPADELGWCLYETVTEGTPVTSVFATAEALIDHLCTVGQDWDQVRCAGRRRRPSSGGAAPSGR